MAKKEVKTDLWVAKQLDECNCFHETKRYVKKLSVTFTKISCF